MFSHQEIRSFNELEMSIYNYILSNKEKVVYMKIRDLADGAHVSTTTVLRFCKKVGCEGYSEFKLRLKQELLEQKSQQPDLDISAMTEFFQRAEGEAYQNSLKKALDILEHSDIVVFIGVGSSAVLGKYGARYFNNAGCLSMCIDDPFTPVFCEESDRVTVIALSVSGTTEQTLNMAGQLKARGSSLISITDSANCPLANMSDCNIAYYIPVLRLDEYFDLTSQIPVLFTLETLGRRLCGRKRKTVTLKNKEPEL